MYDLFSQNMLSVTAGSFNISAFLSDSLLSLPFLPVFKVPPHLENKYIILIEPVYITVQETLCLRVYWERRCAVLKFPPSRKKLEALDQMVVST